MIKQGLYTITENQRIAQGIFRMVLEGDTSSITAPGQFVNIKLENNYLRRPISIADWDEKTITLLYKVVGKGTSQMAELPIGQTLDLLTGLGNGFTTLNSQLSTLNYLLIGGGIGLAPLYGLAKRLDNCTVVIGAATKDELFYVDEFKALGAKVIISTDDGSEGVKGFVTDALSTLNSQLSTLNYYLYTCGPMLMMKAVCKMCEGISGQVSLEERMGCGFGACMGCSVKVKSQKSGAISENEKWVAKRVCKDGPIFNKEDVIW